MLNKKIAGLLFVVGLMAQTVEATKYMIGIRQAGEPMWGAKDSENQRVLGRQLCLSVLMIEDVKTDLGLFEYIESTPENVAFFYIEDNANWLVCVPNASKRVKESGFTFSDDNLVEQLRELLGIGTEFVHEPTSWYLYPYEDSFGDDDALAALCAKVGARKTPAHRRASSSGRFDEVYPTSSVVAVYGNSAAARRGVFSGGFSGPVDADSAPCAPRNGEDDGEDCARRTSMSAIDQQAFVVALLSGMDLKDGEDSEEDSVASDDGNDGDADSLDLGAGGDGDEDPSNDMSAVD